MRTAPSTSATDVLNMSWGGSTFPSYEGQMNTAVTPDAGSGGGTPTPAASAPASSSTPSPSSAATGAASGTGVTPTSASPAGNGSTPAASPTVQPGTSGSPAGAVNPNDDNIRTLRTNYDRLKPWETVASRFKSPAELDAQLGTINAINTEATELAEALGYTKESLAKALATDPVDTLQHLRAEAKKTNPGVLSQRAVREMVSKELGKAVQPLTAEINQQKTTVAMQKLEGEFTDAINNDPIFGADTPKEIRDILFDLVETMAPDNAFVDLKMHGKTAGIRAAIDQVKSQFVTLNNAYNKMLADRAGKPGGGNFRKDGQGTGSDAPKPGRTFDPNKPLTLDDIISGNSDLGTGF